VDVKRAADLYAQGWTLRQIDLARKLHAVGSLNRFEIPRMLSGLSRRISVDQVIAYAVENGWLVDSGPRVSPGDVEPAPAFRRALLLVAVAFWSEDVRG
jgi:hypothetical protein